MSFRSVFLSFELLVGSLSALRPNGHSGQHSLQQLWTDPVDTKQILRLRERSVFGAMLDDCFCLARSDPRELLQLAGGSGIHVNRCRRSGVGRLRRSSWRNRLSRRSAASAHLSARARRSGLAACLGAGLAVCLGAGSRRYGRLPLLQQESDGFVGGAPIRRLTPLMRVQEDSNSSSNSTSQA